MTIAIDTPCPISDFGDNEHEVIVPEKTQPAKSLDGTWEIVINTPYPVSKHCGGHAEVRDNVHS